MPLNLLSVTVSRPALFELPAEIRSLIYEHVFEDILLLSRRKQDFIATYDKSWEQSIKTYGNVCDIQETHPATVLRTSKQFHDEARPVYYAVLTFNVSLHLDSARTFLGTPDITRLIKVLHVDVQLCPEFDVHNSAAGILAFVRYSIWQLTAQINDMPALIDLSLDCFLTGLIWDEVDAYYYVMAEEDLLEDEVFLPATVGRSLCPLHFVRSISQVRISLHLVEAPPAEERPVQLLGDQGIKDLQQSIRNIVSPKLLEVESRMKGVGPEFKPGPLADVVDKMFPIYKDICGSVPVDTFSEHEPWQFKPDTDERIQRPHSYHTTVCMFSETLNRAVEGSIQHQNNDGTHQKSTWRDEATSLCGIIAQLEAELGSAIQRRIAELMSHESSNKVVDSGKIKQLKEAQSSMHVKLQHALGVLDELIEECTTP